MSIRYLTLRVPSCGRNVFWYTSFLRLSSHAPETTGWDKQLFLSLERKLEIERQWKQYVENHKFTSTSDQPRTYILSMFPYPSGKLHMGHVRVYTISDSLARFYRMQGHHVLHPMGWDSFGLPAENAALQRGEDPAVWTEKNIIVMKDQLQQLGCSFDWEREFATSHPDYYKWTQYIFLQMYKSGLIYRKPSLVNWDPVDRTVLADEQIDENGNSWRSGAKAEKKLLTQWFVRSSKFSLSLLKELSNFHKDDWADVINLQKSWIGQVNGWVFDWKVLGAGHSLVLSLWTDQPENIFDVCFVAVKPGSLMDVLQPERCMKEYEYTTEEGDTVTFKAACLEFSACNPFSEEKVPIYVVDGMLPFPDGSESYMGAPSKVSIDLKFSELIGISSNSLKKKSHTREGRTIESLCNEAIQMGFGGYQSSSKLKDWLISRQRYWGTPIPMVHCSKCGEIPVPEDQLPVKLPPFPSVVKMSDEITSPLAQAEEWLNTTCPNCGGAATRETDTMDTFVDSSWYYLRFLDPRNTRALVGKERAREFMPVSIYIGGKEHAILHLYYARIISHFLHKLGISPCCEPFQRLLVQGMVMGQTFIDQETGGYLRRNEVEFRGKEAINRKTGKSVMIRWDKMSKSKHNGVDPSEAISSYGIDTTRLLMLADTAPFSQRNWDPEGSKGVFNWQNNMYVLVSRFIALRQKVHAGKLKHDPADPNFQEGQKNIYELRNKHLSTISHSYRNTHLFMVAIKSMQALTKSLRLFPDETIAFGLRFEEALATLIITLAPMAPHFASELWRGFVSAPNRLRKDSSTVLWENTVLEQTWPKLDDEYELPVHIQVNHKEVCVVKMANLRLQALDENSLLNVALQQEAVIKLLGGKRPEAQEVRNTYERNAIVSLKVEGVTIRDEDQIPSFTKKARQSLSKQKKKKTDTTTS